MNPETQKILLVDDDATLAELYKERMSLEGYKLVIAINGEEALTKAETELPNLILLDLMMPKIDGFQVLERLKANPKTKDIPILVLSALADPENTLKIKAKGALDFLIKSDTTPLGIVQKIKEVLG